MVFKRLLGAVVDGFGHSIGRALFDEAKATNDAPEPPPQDPSSDAPTAKQAAEDAKASEAAARKAERERQKAAARTEKEIDLELAALKRKLGKR